MIELQTMRESEILNRVCSMLAEVAELDRSEVSVETALIGPDAVIDSHGLIELLIEIEDYAESELGFDFDWSSESTFSRNRSAFRRVGTLVEYLAAQAAPVS